jgi:hypothetical protein
VKVGVGVDVDVAVGVAEGVGVTDNHTKVRAWLGAPACS